MADLMELAERVEALQGRNMEVDAEIARATGWVHKCSDVWGIGAPHWWKEDKCFHDFAGPHWYGQGAILPPFTGSLDAAETLVPGGENGRWNTGKFNTDPNKCSAQIAIEDEIFIEAGSLGRGIKVRASATAATPALALCAAALRARASNG